jgi:hypothetical protein
VNALATYPIPDSRLEVRCENWGEYMRWRQRVSSATMVDPTRAAPKRHFFARVASFETNYRSPQAQHWHYGSAPTQAPEADKADAEEIENAVCALDLYHHALLRGHHVERMAPALVLRKAAKAAGQRRGNPFGFLASLGMAYGLLSAALKEPAVIRKIRARERVLEILKG